MHLVSYVMCLEQIKNIEGGGEWAEKLAYVEVLQSFSCRVKRTLDGFRGMSVGSLPYYTYCKKRTPIMLHMTLLRRKHEGLIAGTLSWEVGRTKTRLFPESVKRSHFR